MLLEKPKSFRSEKYLNFVRSKPCCICMMPAPSHAHHLIGIGGNRGASLKADDSLMIPLCAKCHATVHQANGTKKIDQLYYFARFIEAGFRSGEIILNT